MVDSDGISLILFLPLHRGLELFHGDCVQYFAQNDLSDLHAFVCFSIKKVLARVLRIERIDSSAARFASRSRSWRILARRELFRF